MTDPTPVATAASRTEQVRRNVEALIAGIRTGRAKEVYTRFYTPQTRYVEAWQREYPRPMPGAENRTGLDECIEVHEALPVRVLVDGNYAMIEWRILAAARTGARKDAVIPVRQVWIQYWAGNKVEEEEYYVA